MTEVILIAAVGLQGQLGLRSALPWHDSDDLRSFKQTTMHQSIVFGLRTLASLPPLPGRQIIAYDGRQSIEAIIDSCTTEKLFVGGGAYTYEQWAPHVRKMIITRIPYSGPADTYFPWKAYSDLHL